MGKVFFIDKDGNEISDKSFGSHIALAMHLLENSETLKTKYLNRKNKDQNILDFLRDNLGLIKGSSQGVYKIITFDSRSLSDNQRLLLRKYHEEGYQLDDLYIAELRKIEEQKKREGR